MPSILLKYFAHNYLKRGCELGFSVSIAVRTSISAALLRFVYCNQQSAIRGEKGLIWSLPSNSEFMCLNTEMSVEGLLDCAFFPRLAPCCLTCKWADRVRFHGPISNTTVCLL